MLDENSAIRSLNSTATTVRRPIQRMLGIVVALLAAPAIAVLLATGRLPVTGLAVSSVLLFAAVWLLTPPTVGRR